MDVGLGEGPPTLGFSSDLFRGTKASGEHAAIKKLAGAAAGLGSFTEG